MIYNNNIVANRDLQQPDCCESGTRHSMPCVVLLLSLFHKSKDKGLAYDRAFPCGLGGILEFLPFSQISSGEHLVDNTS